MTRDEAKSLKVGDVVQCKNPTDGNILTRWEVCEIKESKSSTTSEPNFSVLYKCVYASDQSGWNLGSHYNNFTRDMVDHASWSIFSKKSGSFIFNF